MNYTELKETIRQSYPEAMIYEKARSAKGGPFRLPIKRWVGYSRSRSFSVEVRGPERKLSRLEFMIGLDDLEKAETAFEAVVAVVAAADPGWNGRDWLLSQASSLTGGELGNVSLSFQSLPLNSGAMLVAFVKVQLG